MSASVCGGGSGASGGRPLVLAHGIARSSWESPVQQREVAAPHHFLNGAPRTPFPRSGFGRGVKEAMRAARSAPAHVPEPVRSAEPVPVRRG
ncbi:MAG: hypothetical protein AVDCRST_MAG68-4211 [uncultured Gemmatimonadetes bacterium]|uniref:Uncharacterized protein n=1 Tax=uncultured Gemmatimonadota bacterium TaxID=203437 RepID=A0A6J4MG69_9BACT|nr:MAG: hypothetical protein AVDCRST_MAG68-4211 [uncultured Gemmatimonadota bacterium]